MPRSLTSVVTAGSAASARYGGAAYAGAAVTGATAATRAIAGMTRMRFMTAPFWLWVTQPGAASRAGTNTIAFERIREPRHGISAQLPGRTGPTALWAVVRAARYLMWHPLMNKGSDRNGGEGYDVLRNARRTIAKME
jgi:hypothetical protein